jgi:N-acetylglucosamine-6-phosphate deacetylase
VTHVWNAMSGIHHRAPGLAGAALADDRLSCDLICDGVHVHPLAVRLAARAKQGRLLLITDRVSPGAGFGAGALVDDGTALRLADGRLAGSRLTLDRAVRNAEAFGAMTQLEAITAATLRPAQLLGLERERGTLRAGARADLVVLDGAGGVAETWLAGERAYTRHEGDVPSSSHPNK